MYVFTLVNVILHDTAKRCPLPRQYTPGSIDTWFSKPCSSYYTHLRYGIEHGAVFGLSHGLSQLALFRPAVKDSKVQGLYFTGASTRPGNGVPLVMIGAQLTAARILKDNAATH